MTGDQKVCDFQGSGCVNEHTKTGNIGAILSGGTFEESTGNPLLFCDRILPLFAVAAILVLNGGNVFSVPGFAFSNECTWSPQIICVTDFVTDLGTLATASRNVFETILATVGGM